MQAMDDHLPGRTKRVYRRQISGGCRWLSVISENHLICAQFYLLFLVVWRYWESRGHGRAWCSAVPMRRWCIARIGLGLSGHGMMDVNPHVVWWRNAKICRQKNVAPCWALPQVLSSNKICPFACLPACLPACPTWPLLPNLPCTKLLSYKIQDSSYLHKVFSVHAAFEIFVLFIYLFPTRG